MSNNPFTNCKLKIIFKKEEQLECSRISVNKKPFGLSNSESIAPVDKMHFYKSCFVQFAIAI